MEEGGPQFSVSPITLNAAWPKVLRLLTSVVLSTIGCILNSFFVAAFIVEKSLRKAANVYVCCLGLADLLISALVVPVTALVLLSGEGDNAAVCHFQHFVVSSSTYAVSLYFLLVAIGNYLRVCKSRETYELFVNAPVSIISFSVALVSVFTAVLGTYGALDYDFCERRHTGIMIYRLTTGTAFFIIPGLVTIYFVLTTYFFIRSKKRGYHYRRTLVYQYDKVEAKCNILGYALFLTSWIPYAIIVFLYPNTSSLRFYSSAWTGVVRSIVCSTVYSLPIKGLRRAYAYLFNCCCCKSTLRVSGSNARHRQAPERTVGNKRVMTHIMGAAFFQRPAVTSEQATTEL